MKPDTGMNFGRQAEITRDELKFSKFVSRLRKKFSELFDDLLKTQLILKNIMSEQDWEAIREDVFYQFAQDSYLTEAKEAEILRNRVDLMNQVNPYIGTYFSREFIYRDILKMDEDDIAKVRKEIEDDAELQQQMQAQAEGPGTLQAAQLTRQISQPREEVELDVINKISLLNSGVNK